MADEDEEDGGNAQPLEPDLPLVPRYRQPNEDDIDLLIEYVKNNPGRLLKGLLEKCNLPKSGTKETIKDNLKDAIASGALLPSTLITHLDEIEGWGDQHVFVYQVPITETRPWRDLDFVSRQLTKQHIDGLINHRRPVVLPNDRTISVIKHSAKRLQLRWVENRTFRKPLKEKNYSEDGIHYTASKDYVDRGITTFDWDLATGEALLFIERMERDDKYEDRRIGVEAEMKSIGLNNLPPVKPESAIKKLSKTAEIDTTGLDVATKVGNKVNLRGTHKGRDAITADIELNSIRETLKNNRVVMGNFYWKKAEPIISRRIHVRVYSNRIGIFGSCFESEVRHILRQVIDNR